MTRKTPSVLAAATLTFSLIACLGGLAGCGQGRHGAGDVTAERLAKDDGSSGNWLLQGNGWSGAYYSPLSDINTTTASRLGFAWQYALPANRGQEATPLMVDGVLYVSTNWGRVVAVDAKTGKGLWTYDPEVDGQWGRYACCDVVNRGVAVWKGVVYVGSTDGYLHAIDAATGARKWKVDTLDRDDRARQAPYTISGAPQIAGDVVVIGNGGADFGVRGFVRAYDLETGAVRWTFHTVPHDPKTGPQETPDLDAALKTWDAKSDWSRGGGGTAWDGMAYDPALNLVYVGTGNSSPYNYRQRSNGKGDNLYLASIVALDAKTGRLRWHYQTVPGEYWDYTATAKLILADLKFEGRARHVILQAPKNGYFYALDRETGEVLTAKPYTFINWSTGVDPKTKRAILNPVADYLTNPKLIYPSMAGGHNWQPMSFSPKTGLVYIPVIDAPMVFAETSKAVIKETPGAFTTLGAFPEGYDPKAMAGLYGPLPPLDALAKIAGGPAKPSSKGVIRALDPVTGKIVWEQPTNSFWDGGVLSTGGDIVVSGDAAGRLNVRRADTGALITSIDTGSFILAAPMTYKIDGVQYVAVEAGFGGGGGTAFPPGSAADKYGNAARLLVFKLDGGPTPLPPPRPTPKFNEPPPALSFTAAQAKRGEVTYMRQCARCHNEGPGYIPDLRRISRSTHAQFKDIVLNGLYRPAGMGSFKDVLTPDDVEDVHAYVALQQNRLYAQENPKGAR